jgi:hypothetical protein
MTRVLRNRSRPSPYKGGSAIQSKRGVPIVTTNPDRSSYTSSCTDRTGSPVVDSPFDSRQYRGVYPFVNGTFNPTVNASIDTVRFDVYTVAGLPSAMINAIPLPAPNGWMLDLVAGTNPSRPVLNIPEAVENIVSLPKMVKSLGDLILHPRSRMSPKGLAGEYLGVQFGWLPLIEDLTKLLNIQNYANKRNKELHELYSGKGLRRRLKFADDTTVTATISQFGVSTSVFTHNCSLMVKRRQWGTIHWYPTTPPPYHPDDLRWNDLSRRLVLGATPEAMANGLWKVIPWTWLIGWFTNFGKYTLANSWTVPATHGTGCFMSKAEATYMSAGFSCTNASINQMDHGGVATRTVSTRIVSSSVLAGANMPYLDIFRLSILGSLFAQRFLK